MVLLKEPFVNGVLVGADTETSPDSLKEETIQGCEY